ncbi:hypothetical protein N182_18660 [Sinorhizobium sp. GL2]|nr:hypothetical protein N182_18660 [Sinorhizobium sp. GL2]
MTIDVELLASFAAKLDCIGEPEPDKFINWLGIKTDASLFPDNPNLAGQILKDLPTGGDGVYGSYREYAAFLTAIREKGEDRGSFAAVELGAGWGPWVSSIGKVCQREGFSQINLVAVEAGQARIDALHRHLRDNGLLADEAINVKIIEGAAWSHDGPLYFPVVGAVDHGGAASQSAGKTDYRGHDALFVEVDGVGLATICDGIDRVDFMHWDVRAQS